MQSLKQSSSPIVSPQAARLLVLRRTLAILEVTGDEALSVSEIAKALGESIERTWRQVRKLVSAGILKEHSLRKRAGRAQKLYKASADEFVVPDAVRHRTVSNELSQILEDSIARNDHASAERFFFDGSRWCVEKLYDGDAASERMQHEMWLVARLDARQRGKLKREIADVFKRYQVDQSSTAKQYLVRFACAVFDED